jgi:hypothetical protein
VVSLRDQGFRFVVRVVDGRIEGDWKHPADVKPEWLDCTDMDDETFCEVMERMRQRVRQEAR